MPASSSRSLWKGAISFGLVNIPVALHSATADDGIDFDWIDKRSMDPVGYQRINKKTGKTIDKENIVRGIAQDSGEYVVLSDEEIAGAYPKTTQTIEMDAFVSPGEIPFVFLERPYYLAPYGRGSAKVYALLRETLARKQLVGVARFVLHSKQHLAVVAPSGPALVLNTLRWESGVRSFEGLELPPEGVEKAGLSLKEMDMAERLVDDMAGHWKAGEYTDSFRERIEALVAEKRKEGKLENVSRPGEEDDGEKSGGAEVIDLTELLQRSLKRGASAPAKKAPAKAAGKTTAARKAAPARKRA